MESNEETTFNESSQDSLINSNKSKKPLISFAKINKYFIIPFIAPVFCMLANYFLQKIRDTKVIKHEEFFTPLYTTLSYIGAGCFYFISKFRQKVEEQKEKIIYKETNTNSIQYIYNEGIKINVLKVLIFIIVIAFLICLFELLSVYNSLHNFNIFEERLYFYLFIPLFSKFILKDNLFKHHYFALLIALSGIILLIIPICLKIKVNDALPNVYNLIGAVGYSLFLVLIKHVIHAYYISPFKLGFIFGVIAFLFIFFGYFIYTLIKYHDFTYFKESFDFSNYENKFVLSLYFIATFIFALALQFSTLLVIFYFSPILLMVTDIISPFLAWVVIMIEKPEARELPKAILDPIGYIIILFASLIYNEIIIFNFCNLNKNTTKFIEERIDEESKDLRKTANDLKLGTFDRSDEDNNSNEEDKNSHSS